VRGRTGLLVAGPAAVVLVVLTAWVATTTPAVDRWGRGHLDVQITSVRAVASVVLTVLAPPVLSGALLAYAALRAYRARDRRDLLVAAGVVVTLAVAVLGLKHAIARPSPYPQPDALAFPSGHTATALVCAGTAALLGARRSVAAWAAVAGLTGLEAGALLVRSAHWVTDIAAGAALGVVLLVGAAWATRDSGRAAGR
jgi:membrane-associated phospholipid phosphatase